MEGDFARDPLRAACLRGEDMSDSHQVHVGIKWIGASLAITQFVRFVTTAILARLLTPEIFGLVAMAHVAISLIGVIREVGIGNAYIQRRDRGPEDAVAAANTTFFMSLGINGTLFLLAWLAAPLVILFFENDQLLNVLRAMFVVFLIDAFDTTPTMIIQKRLEFDKNALGEIAASAVNASVAITMAFFGFGVWSLVAGQLVSRSARAGLVFKLSGFRPAAQFDRGIARELFDYGRYLWAFAVLSAVGGSLDRMILGRGLGAASLGVYEMAHNLSNLPATQISRLVNRITFPSFSLRQEDLPSLRAALHKTIRHVSILSVPVACGIYAVSSDLILTVYGEKWRDAIPIIEVLAFYGLSLSLSSITGPTLKAIGKPHVLFYSSVAHHALLAVLLLALAPHGAVAIAYAVLIPMLMSAALAYGLIVHYIDYPVRDLLEPLLRTGTPGVVMVFAVVRADAWIDARYDLAVPLSLLASVAIGVGVYGLVSVFVNRASVLELASTLHRALVARRGAPADAEPST